MMFMRPDSLSYHDDSNSSPQDYSSQGLDLSPKSSQSSPRGQLNNLVYSRCMEQSRIPSQETAMSESTNGRYVNTSDEHFLHHQEHYSRQTEESATNQADLDMQISSQTTQSEALNMKIEPKDNGFEKAEGDNVIENDRETDQCSVDRSPNMQRESPVDNRLLDQNFHSSYLPSNNIVAVSHSMT